MAAVRKPPSTGLAHILHREDIQPPAFTLEVEAGGFLASRLGCPRAAPSDHPRRRSDGWPGYV